MSESERSSQIEKPNLIALSPLQQARKRELEETISAARSSFYQAGLALKEIRDTGLYLETHTSFESYCLHRFKLKKTAAYYKIAASSIYEVIRAATFTNCEPPNEPNTSNELTLPLPLPTRESQLRAIVDAKLSNDQQVAAWRTCVLESEGKVPTGQMVKSIVDRIRERTPVPNPWRTGEVVRILVKGNPDLKGRGGQWAIVEEVHNFSVTVCFWDGLFPHPIKIEHLNEWVLLPAERLEMRKLCERINKLKEQELSQPVINFLAGLGKLQFPRLSELEEKLLRLIENSF